MSKLKVNITTAEKALHSNQENEFDYEELSPRSHVLKRSGMYIESIASKVSTEYIVTKLNSDQAKIVKKDIQFNLGLVRLFIEALSNSIDNFFRSKKTKNACSQIKIDFNEDTNELSVWNNGLTIPIEINKQTKIYNPQMVFGRLLTSSNYNDEKERSLIGMNGLGAKCINIFSKCFQVIVIDKKKKLKYSQIWTDNMAICHQPIIEKLEGSEITNSVQVKWQADLAKFGLQNYDINCLANIEKLCIDASMVTGIPVSFNQTIYHIKSFLDYAKLFDKNETEECVQIKNKNCEIVIKLSETEEFEAISFVNGLFVKEGGVHIKSYCDAIFKPILDKLNETKKSTSKDGGPKLIMKDILNKFKLFINITIDQPQFSSQSKVSLTGPKVVAQVDEKYIKQILKWKIIQDLKDLLNFKQSNILKKHEKTKATILIPDYDKANLSGSSKQGNKCTLVICEGLSAKTFCVKGIHKGCFDQVGRDYFGILPIRGKFINVLGATPNQLVENSEIKALIQVLNLKQFVDYSKKENFETLNYGKLMILSDSDVDGIHIRGLLLNFFHCLYPSLVRTNEFVYFMRTPIVCLKYKSQDYEFYDLYDGQKFIEQNKVDSNKIKYLKGLGSSTDKMIDQVFGKRVAKFICNEKYEEFMKKSFHKDFANERKQWLLEYDENVRFLQNSIDGSIEHMKISSFIQNELITYWVADCKRSIPHVFDGLKISQRKVLFACLKKKLTYLHPGMKTAQLGGYVAGESSYHSGEQNLFETIAKMGQKFTSSNNICLLDDLTQFGTRLELGKDVSSPRYTFTRLTKVVGLLFRKEDDLILNYLNDEGLSVEPEFYLPIIPLILVNGCSGIGSGFSSNIPNHHPVQIIDWIKSWLQNDRSKRLLMQAELCPWYKGFDGSIIKDPTCSHKWKVQGIVDQKKKDQFHVRELPLSKSINKFTNELQILQQETTIKNFDNYSEPNKVDFIIHCYKDGFKPSVENLKLYDYLHTSNMVLFNEDNHLIRYKDITQILLTFCHKRLEYYSKRIKTQISQLKVDLEFNERKFKFIFSVVNHEIILFKKTKKDVQEQILKKNIMKDIVDINKQKEIFDDLFSIKSSAYTDEELDKITKQKNDAIANLQFLQNQTPERLWLKELDELKCYLEKNL